MYWLWGLDGESWGLCSEDVLRVVEIERWIVGLWEYGGMYGEISMKNESEKVSVKEREGDREERD